MSRKIRIYFYKCFKETALCIGAVDINKYLLRLSFTIVVDKKTHLQNAIRQTETSTFIQKIHFPGKQISTSCKTPFTLKHSTIQIPDTRCFNKRL